MPEYALLQIVDRCTRCGACMGACERNWGLLPSTGSSFNNTTREFSDSGKCDRMQADDLVVVKSQSAGDQGPYVRYSCWHCYDPPCLKACNSTGIRAISRDLNGAVWVDWNRCFPNLCKAFGGGRARPCVADCGRGGYVKVGVGNKDIASQKAYKCQLCHDRLTTVPAGKRGAPGSTETKATACAAACPRSAMVYDTKASITANYLNGQYVYTAGDGNMYWVSGPAADYKTLGATEFAKKYAFTPPTSDPFVDDHISPLFERVLLSPAARLMAVPTLLVGGLYAVYRRRLELEESKSA